MRSSLIDASIADAFPRPRDPYPRPRSRRGFTLIEVLLSITIAGALLVAAVSLALSMGEVWGNGSGKRLFDQHVRGVTRFLDTVLRQAEPLCTLHAQPPSCTDVKGCSCA